MLLDPLSIQTRKHGIINVHGLFLLLVRIIERHVCSLMKDVEPELP